MIKWGNKGAECVRDGVATLQCLPTVFLYVIDALLMFAGIFALFIFIMGGYKFINSGGDAKKLEGAKNNLLYGTIGLIVILMSFFILNIISTVTGVDCIKSGTFNFGCK